MDEINSTGDVAQIRGAGKKGSDFKLRVSLSVTGGQSRQQWP